MVCRRRCLLPHRLSCFGLIRRPRRSRRLAKKVQRTAIRLPCSRNNFRQRTEDVVVDVKEENRNVTTDGTRDESGIPNGSVLSLAGIPLPPTSQTPESGVVFIFEKASLVPAYIGKKYQIINPDEHADFLRRRNMNPADYRPDIIHEVLVYLMSSRLNLSGGVQAVYVKTDQGLLIQFDPRVLLPKKLDEFCSMISQLLQRFSIKARGKGGKLLRLLENPVTNHLPRNSHIIGLSFSSEKYVSLRDYVTSIHSDRTLVFVVGAMAHGKIGADYVHDLIKVGDMPLSAGICIRRLCAAVEKRRKIV